MDVQEKQVELQRDRKTVMAQTKQFMLQINTYKPDLLKNNAMPEYRERMKKIITPKFTMSFDQKTATTKQLVAQTRISREAKVFATDVSTIDADSATALITDAFTDSYPKNADKQQAPEPTPFRIEVRLVKVNNT